MTVRQYSSISRAFATDYDAAAQSFAPRNIGTLSDPCRVLCTKRTQRFLPFRTDVTAILVIAAYRVIRSPVASTFVAAGYRRVCVFAVVTLSRKSVDEIFVNAP